MRVSGGSSEELDGTYRVVWQHVTSAQGEITATASTKIAARRGPKALIKRECAREALAAATQACETAVDRLIQAHLRAGDREPQAVADRIQTDLLNKLSAPGLSLLHGRGSEAAALVRERQLHLGDFEGWRTRCRSQLADRFLAARGEYDGDSTARLARRAKDHPVGVVAGVALFVAATLAALHLWWR